MRRLGRSTFDIGMAVMVLAAALLLMVAGPLDSMARKRDDPPAGICGSGECIPPEDCSNCPADCGGCCGQGGCQAQHGETRCTCPGDCGEPCEDKQCGDDGCGGSCGDCGEDEECIDGACVGGCGDGACLEPETFFTCPADCPNEDCPGCFQRYMDNDGDGFGIPQSKCLCQPDGAYSADNVLDCDDSDPDINPDADEDCLTVGIDDNCNGTANDMDGLGCDDYYEDKDDDGFGVGAPVCICSPQSVYVAPNSNDCNDSNGQVFPGQKEKCSTNYDDNCDGNTNEPDATGCTPWWVDMDGDGYAGTQVCYCEAPANAEDYPEDCCDADPEARPGQPKYFSTPVNWCGGFDYDCDSAETEQYDSSCVQEPCSAGWFQPTPTCGTTGNWCLNCNGCGSCIGQTIQQKQKCR